MIATRPNRLSSLLLAAIALPFLMVAAVGGQEIRRVRVPVERLEEVFPAGSELRCLPLPDFLELERNARRGFTANRADSVPRLVRALHKARWDGELLRGESDLTIDRALDASSTVELEPWSPAALSSDLGLNGASLITSRDGVLAIRGPLPPAAQVRFSWELKARRLSEGRVFRLELPRIEATELILDLPAGTRPVGIGAVREGPLPSDGPGRSLWRFLGTFSGTIEDLRLFDEQFESGLTPPQVQGTSLIEVQDSTATWTSEWKADLGEALPPKLLFALEGGLQITAVEGSTVLGFTQQRDASGDKLQILLSSEGGQTRDIRLRGIAPVPAEGKWTVPGARVLDALWLGGRAAVRVAPTRTIDSEMPLAGLRSEPTDQERGDFPGAVLAYSLAKPGAAAELGLRRAGSWPVADVRGQVMLGRTTTRLDALATWRPRGDGPRELKLDIPEGWTIEELALVGLSNPPSWSQEPRVGGGSRLVILLPASLDVSRILEVSLSATSSGIAVPGTFNLPRFLPVEAETRDERWVVWAEAGYDLRPAQAQGLAWLEPAAVGLEPPSVAQTSLAWRWLLPNGSGQIVIGGQPPLVNSDVFALSMLTSNRLREEARVAVHAGETTIRAIPVRMEEAADPAWTWRLSDDLTGAPLPVRKASSAEARKLELPEDAQVWWVEFPNPRRGTVEIRAVWESPWKGRDRLPLLSLPPSYRMKGTAVILVDRPVRTTAEALGMHRLDPDLAWSLGTRGEAIQARDNKYRIAHAFGYDNQAQRLLVSTETLEPDSSTGLIQEAILSTPVDTKGESLQTLKLRVLSISDDELGVRFPQGIRVQSIRINGRRVVATSLQSGLSIPLAQPFSPNSPENLVEIDFDSACPRSILPAPRPLPRPEFSFPCLAFTWELPATEPTTLLNLKPALPEAWPSRRWNWTERLLDDWRPWDSRGLLDLDGNARTQLAGLASSTRRGPLSLGELLSRWDAGPLPLIVDHLALREEGWGPFSTIAPSPAQNQRSAAPTSDLDSLSSRGIALVSRPGSILVTTRSNQLSESSPSRETAAWRKTVEQVLRQGYDRGDRYQTVPDWLSGSQDRLPTNPEGSTRTSSIQHGREMFRFVGWPASSHVAWTIRSDQLQAVGWAAGLIVFFLGVLARDARAAWKARLIGLLAAAALGLAAWGEGILLAVLARGFFLGCVACLIYWMGRALSSPLGSVTAARSRNVPLGTTAANRRRTGELACLMLMAAACFTVAPRALPARPDGNAQPGGETIVAVMPVEGDSEPTHIWLRRSDYDALLGWSQLSQSDKRAQTLWCEAVHHRIGPAKAGLISIESRYRIRALGDGQAPWAIPATSSREITAELDGQNTPVVLTSGGREAQVWFSGSGLHELVFRRLQPTSAEAGATRLRLPVNPCALAVVENTLEQGAIPQIVETARGGSEPQGITRLGPADQIVLNMADAPDSPTTSGNPGSVDLAILWDADLAGDRVRARLRPRGGPPRSELRVELGPGLFVRGALAPGMVFNATTATTTTSPSPSGSPSSIWTARFLPPLEQDTPVTLELYRQSPWKGADSALAPRPWPRLTPLETGVARYALGVRSLPGWACQVPAPPGAQTIESSEFLKLWNSGEPASPADQPSASIAFQEWPGEASASFAPPPLNRSLQPATTLTLSPGRIDFQSETLIEETSGQSWEILADVSEPLRILDVSCPGLTSWSRPTTTQLSCRFDGPSSSTQTTRKLRVAGWLPVPVDPLAPEPKPAPVELPYVAWRNGLPREGLLTIRSPSDLNYKLTPVIRMLSSSNSPGTSFLSTTYLADDIPGTTQLEWGAEPARSQVTASSLFTLHPDSAQFEASVRYRVAGGPLSAIVLSMPESWGRLVALEAVGRSEKFVAEERDGQTIWTLRPLTPAWGTQQVLIRGIQPLGAARDWTYPDLLPRGRGEVVSFLGLSNATGLPLATEGLGVQPVDPSKLLDDQAIKPTPGAPLEAFRIEADRWLLKAQVPGQNGSSRLDDRLKKASSSRVRLARMACVIDEAIICWGHVRYDLDGKSGPFLNLTMPPQASSLGVCVDGRPVRPLAGSDGELSIPLGNSLAREVEVAWRTPPTHSSKTQPASLPLPRLNQPGLLTLVTILAPDGLLPELIGTGALTIGPHQITLHELELLGQNIRENAFLLDRSSTDQRSRLLSDLIRFELLARSVERSASVAARARKPGLIQISRDNTSARLRTARATLLETLRSAGLDTFLESAAFRVGLEKDDPLAELPAPISGPDLLRLPRIGNSVNYQVRERSPGDVLSISCRRSSPPWSKKIAGNLTITSGTESAACATMMGALLLLPWLFGRALDSAGRRLILLAAIAALTTLGLLAPLTGAAMLLLFALAALRL